MELIWEFLQAADDPLELLSAIALVCFIPFLSVVWVVSTLRDAKERNTTAYFRVGVFSLTSFILLSATLTNTPFNAGLGVVMVFWAVAVLWTPDE